MPRGNELPASLITSFVASHSAPEIIRISKMTQYLHLSSCREWLCQFPKERDCHHNQVLEHFEKKVFCRSLLCFPGYYLDWDWPV